MHTIIDTPAFTNQPTITETELNSSFVPWNESYYYVHVVDSEAGTFQLMTTYNDSSTCIDQTFTLSGLATGNSGTLKENSLVDFLTTGDEWQMRSAGVRIIDTPTFSAKSVNIKFTGFSNQSGYIRINNIYPFTSTDIYYQTDKLTTSYDGPNGFLLSKTSYVKNIFTALEFNLSVGTKYILLSGDYMAKQMKEDRITMVNASNVMTDSLATMGHMKDFSDLPASEITKFSVYLDGSMLNGSELTITEN